jgi:hypothetical protein
VPPSYRALLSAGNARRGHELIAAEPLMLTGSTDCPGGPGRFRGTKYRMYQKTLVRHLNWRNRSIAARKE